MSRAARRRDVLRGDVRSQPMDARHRSGAGARRVRLRVAPTSSRVPSSRTARCRARERLVRVEESGYEVVLAWPDEDWDGAISFDRLKYSREAQQGILEYLHRNGTR